MLVFRYIFIVLKCIYIYIVVVLKVNNARYILFMQLSIFGRKILALKELEKFGKTNFKNFVILFRNYCNHTHVFIYTYFIVISVTRSYYFQDILYISVTIETETGKKQRMEIISLRV
jgi:hypothetical protein